MNTSPRDVIVVPPSPSPPSLARILDLEQIGPSEFRRPGRPGAARRMFGGEVVGQAIVAAGLTLGPDRTVISATANFLLPGDTSKPVDFRVERSREGRSFSNRHVVAVQGDETIFHLAATSQVFEDGLAHQVSRPDAPEPESLPTPQEMFAGNEANLAWITSLLSRNPIECRFALSPPRAQGVRGEPGEPRQQVWVRVPEPMPSDPLLHRAGLGYISDLFLMASGVAPHGRTIQDADLKFASINHSVWFRSQPDLGSWLLYDQVGLWSGGGRTLCQGTFYDRAGNLVASVMQEALIRVLAPTGG